ncbi:hypothetical protein SEA_RASPUTIA_101 [Microbacterium phage Rasputia]|nr:hypothetical protein SEA_RASPUTIA_101 [Microbacterium phage Rasputia]
MSGQELDVLSAVDEVKSFPGLVWFGARPAGMTGVQALFRFENNWGISMIKGSGSYGIEAAAVVYYEGSMPSGDPQEDYLNDTHSGWDLDLDEEHWAYALASDVHGYLNAETFLELLTKMKALPDLQLPRPAQTIGSSQTQQEVES